MWDCSVFTQYSYYRDLFCSVPEFYLCYHYRHGWVRYIDTTKTTVWYMSSLLLSIYIWLFCCFIMFYFKLTNGTIVKWWMLEWWNGEIKISIGRLLFSQIWNMFIFNFRKQHFRSRQSNHNLRIKNKQTLICYYNA